MASGETPVYQLRYPLPTDVIDLAGDLADLALDIDAAIATHVSDITSTLNAVPRFSGTGGEIKNSAVTIDNSNNLAVPGDITATDITGTGVMTVDTTGIGIDSIITIDSDVAYSALLALKADGSDKWKVVRNANDHDLKLYSYGSASYPLTLDYANGNAVFDADVTVGGDITSTSAAHNLAYNNAGAAAVSLGSTFVKRASTGAGDVVFWAQGTSTVGIACYADGDVNLGKDLTVTGDIELGSGGPTITTGSAVPSASEPQGSKYIRTTTLGDHEYVATDGVGTWAVTGAADTGRRDMSAESLSNSWTVGSSRFHLQRVGNMVTLQATFDGTSATTGEIYNLPAGFLPSGLVTFPVSYGTSASRMCQVSMGGNMYMNSYGASTHFICASWPTDDAWPTSLPGT